MAYSMRELRRDLASRNTPVQRWIDGTLWRLRHGRARAAARPDPAKMAVVFAIPLISRAKADNWEGVEANLAATIATLRAQTDDRWQAVICCQDRPERIAFDAHVHFLPYPDHPPGIDKYHKAGHILRWLPESPVRAGYYFPLDADDLIHPDLVRHMLADDNRAGYRIPKGYMLDHETLALAVLQPPDAAYPEATHFFRSCGSSSAVYFDFDSGADYSAVLAARGNHRKVVRNMGYFGLRVDDVPFHAAIYVMNHGDNLRQKRGLMSGKMKHFDLNPVRDPAEVARIGETFGFARLFPGRWPAPPAG